MNSVTVDQIMAIRPCSRDYPRSRVKALGAGRKRITLRGVAKLDIPIHDRLRLLDQMRPDIRDERLTIMVERAIRRSLGKSGCDAWERWADGWLSGEGRSAAAAADAFYAAAAAAAAAYAAARADDAEYEQQLADFLELAYRKGDR